MDSIKDIQIQCIEDSIAWFPEQSRDLMFVTVAMTGELGEFANLLKKCERGSITFTDEVKMAMQEELCDIFIYLCNAAVILGVDLGKIYDEKRRINVERFGKQPKLVTD